MLQVKIKSIGTQGILDDMDYAWVKLHIDTPVQVMSMNFQQGEAHPWSITVFKEDGGIVSLFVDSMRVKYEFIGHLPTRNAHCGGYYV